MALIKWTDDFSVQNADMDKQHQHLFALINKLHNAMSLGKSKETLPEVFDSLVKYTQTHFAAEEALLQKHGYPGFVLHKRQHDDLVLQVSNLRKQFLSGDVSASIQTRNFLKQWLMEHIKGSDQKYGAFLDQKGI